MLERTERLGALFAPLPGRRLPIAYQYGPSHAKSVMFQCPVSAIPPVVWDLLADWRACRSFHTLPVAGGWRDQPLLVRRAFPVFEAEMRAVERAQAHESSMQGLLAAMKAMRGR